MLTSTSQSTLSLIALVAGLLITDPTVAQSSQGVIEVNLHIERGCLFQTRQDFDGQHLGTLDFGSHTRLDALHRLSTQLNGNAAPIPHMQARLECNPGINYELQMDGGLNGGVGDVRYMANTDADAPATPYRLYSDAAMQQSISVRTPLIRKVPSSGLAELPVYARIEHLNLAPTPGRYRDTIYLTLTW
ncbi:Spore Coat Protein U domain protein [compost metagenome]